MMFNANKLLLTLLDEGGGRVGARARYVVLRGRAVRAEGECAMAELPAGGTLRTSFLARGSYFDRVDAEVKSAKMLPFQARRLVEGALAFNEPFRVRFTAKDLGSGRQRLDLLAVSEADFGAAASQLPTQSRACERIALVESAIAALVAQETPEPADVLWLRGPNLLGLVVENGAVLARLLDRPAIGAGDEGGEDALAGRIERMRGSLQAAARRAFPGREVSLHLALGELAADAPSARGAAADAASSALETRLARRFTGGQPRAPLQWPEVYGLLTLANGYSLLDTGYQQRAWAEKAALGLGAALLAGGLATAATAAARYVEWERTRADYASRSGKVAADHAGLKPRLPTPAQLAALEQRLKVEGGASDFRVDALLAWISAITPNGAIIRKLEAGGGKTGGAAAPASGVAPAPGAAAAPAASAGLNVSVEWELQGDYPAIEKLAAQLAERLGERAALTGSKLEYTPGEAARTTARLTTVLAPLPGLFSK